MSKDKKKGGKGVNAELQPSEELAAIVGSDPISRGQVMKSLWKYIKKHDLQNPDDKREILCDSKMRPVFGKKTHMLKLGGAIGDHLS